MRSQDTRQTRRNASAAYVRHRPETTLLYQVIREYWPGFQAELASHGKYLPAFICREFDEYLKCGRLEHGFLRVRCESCHHEKLVAFSCKRRGFCPSCGARRMAESAALLVDAVLPHQPIRQWVLSVPFPLRFLFASRPAIMSRVLGIVYRAGVYIGGPGGSAKRFRWVKAPTSDELTQLTHTIAQRIARCLERQGLLVRDADNNYLTAHAVDSADDDPMHHLLGHSITYRIAVGPPTASIGRW